MEECERRDAGNVSRRERYGLKALVNVRSKK